MQLEWQVEECALSESYRAHRLLADRVLDNGNVSGYCSLLPNEFICRFTFTIWWEECQIMEVIDLKKQQFKILFICIF